MRLTLGERIRHIKRNSEYEVIGFSACYLDGTDRLPVDGEKAWLLVCMAPHVGEWSQISRSTDLIGECDIALPLEVQISGDYAGAEWIDMVIYRQVGGEGLIFARPKVEFTKDRFGKIEPESNDAE